MPNEITINPQARPITLSLEELATAALLVTDPDDPRLSLEHAQTRLQSLAEAGILAPRKIPRYVAEIVRTVALPELTIEVSAYGIQANNSEAQESQEGSDVFTIWATTKFGVTGRYIDDERMQYDLIKPEYIPLVVAQEVHLEPRALPPATGPLSLQLSVYLQAVELLVSEEGTGAGAAYALLCEQPGFDERSASTMLGIIQDANNSWQARSYWHDYRGIEHETSVSVVDAGESGLWLVEDTELDLQFEVEPTITYTPADSQTVWERIIELLPSSEKLAAQEQSA